MQDNGSDESEDDEDLPIDILSPSLIEERVQVMTTRTADRNIPYGKFGTLFSNLNLIPANQMKVLILMLPAAIGVKEEFFKERDLQELHTLFDQVQAITRMLHLTNFSEEDVHQLGMLCLWVLLFMGVLLLIASSVF